MFGFGTAGFFDETSVDFKDFLCVQGKLLLAIVRPDPVSEGIEGPDGSDGPDSLGGGFGDGFVEADD